MGFMILSFFKCNVFHCPSKCFNSYKKYADYVTKSNGSERAVAEACLHILAKFFSLEYNDILEIGL